MTIDPPWKKDELVIQHSGNPNIGKLKKQQLFV
jgi:hypothetical protein